MIDLLPLLLVGVAALLASTLAAVTGFGGAAIMLPVLVWAFGVRDAVPILTVAQLLGNLSRVWFNRGDLSFPVVGRFMLGAVPTAAIGGVIFATAPAAVLVRLLGAFLLLIVAVRHTTWGKDARISLSGFMPLGIVSGLISALVGTVGPFMAPFFVSYGLVKGAYIGTEALSTVAMHVTKLGVYSSYNLLGPSSLTVGMAIGLVMFGGSYLGKLLLDKVSEGVFPYLIEAVLIAAGLLFLIRG